MSTINISRESISGFISGSGTVGTLEQRLSPINRTITKFVVVRNDSANWIAVGVPGGAINGFILHAGESSPRIYAEKTDAIAIVGGAGNLNYSYIGS